MNEVRFAYVISVAVYLAGIIAAGIAFGSPVAVKLAIACAGACAICYLAQDTFEEAAEESRIQWVAALVGLITLPASWVAGIAAGVALLI